MVVATVDLGLPDPNTFVASSLVPAWQAVGVFVAAIIAYWLLLNLAKSMSGR